MILINGLSAMGLCLSVGLFYIFSGLYYEVTVPVQPTKVIGAYAVETATSPAQVSASAAWIGLIMLIIGSSGAVTLIGCYTPESVIHGVQLSTGVLLKAEGVSFMMGTSRLQQLQNASKPYLAVQNLGPVPLGIVLGEASRNVTYKGLCISMGLANFLAFFLEGMPLCHGAGGLAAHYRFGARTAGSNLMIGAILVALTVFLGSHALSVLYLLPMSILGITVASNLTVGFIVGIVLAYALRWDKLNP